jgi:hypothetical protein
MNAFKNIWPTYLKIDKEIIAHRSDSYVISHEKIISPKYDDHAKLKPQA